ncbi:MAG: hypothetical protein H7Y42_01635, partial [Chitinophagaceae bacterium]|nr:hypothetical protein [Chitinophagaceae bacterium]
NLTHLINAIQTIKIETKISNSKINSGSMPSSWTTLSDFRYNALGQLQKKRLGSYPLDSLVYDYNIRGWVLGINRDYVKDTASTSNWFGFDLGYDRASFTVNGASKAYTTAQYTGNIGGLLWKSTGDDRLRKYDFVYDPANRLVSADFNQLTNNNFSKTAGIDFSVSGLNYDGNGNILNMNQRGWKITGSETIDSLLYTYSSNTNKLLNVVDRRNDTATRLGDFRSSPAYMSSLSQNKSTGATDYAYDGNGNMNVDLNKDISGIHYNHLNLPDSIIVANKGYIKYVYDAAGTKLKKVVSQGSNTSTTLYLFGTYSNDTLQFIGTEEGRARPKDSSAFVFDYFFKDHLENVRMVLTEERDTSFYPPASMETAQSTSESLFYGNLNETRTSNLPHGYPNDPYSSPNDYVALVSNNGLIIGPNITLKVMAGDRFNLRVSSYYQLTTSMDPPEDPTADLLDAINNSIGTITETHNGPKLFDLQSSGILSPGIVSFLTSQSYNATKPKAYVNWILFDEQLNFVANSSGFEQVGDEDDLTIHAFNDLPVSKSGYLYIYVSNTTKDIDVFFDNLQVTHIKGALLEETHYYPFGLAMAGISSKVLKGNYPENKKKFVAQDFDADLGLNLYQFKYRNHDPQIGRFVEIDPLADDYEHNGTYNYAENRPIDGIDLEGLEFWRKVGNALADVWENGVKPGLDFLNENINPLVPLAEVVTGKSYASNFTEEKSRWESGPQAVATFFPLAKGAGTAAKAGKAVAKETAEAGEKAVTKVPNPYGKRGGPAHQNKVAEVSDDLGKKGYDKIETEVQVKTPGGKKETRYVDVQGTNTTTGEVLQVQVGKKNKDWTPVSRERQALDDIEKATKARPLFVPYN